MKNISEVLEGVKTIGIGGHVRPDGDCVGSCMALYLYIRTYFPDVDVSVYLDHPKPIFGHIDHIDDIKTEVEEGREFDLFITCDVSARDRLAVAGDAFDHAAKNRLHRSSCEQSGICGCQLYPRRSQLLLRSPLRTPGSGQSKPSDRDSSLYRNDP